MEENIYLALLHSIGFTHKKLHAVFEFEQNYSEFYHNIKNYDLGKFGFKKNEIEKIHKNYGNVSKQSIEEALKSREVDIVTIKDKTYPESLKNIANPPFLIYVRGKLSSSPKIGVVGSRKITSYGAKVIENIVPEVSQYFEIVSGGAYGCDTQAHVSALEAGNITVSVIGTSICEDYPVGNEKLYYDIVNSGGAVVSIFPIGVPGSAYNFPVRNEVVVGLSNGILVVEAQQRSGSLITAHLALDLGKDLFAIPGDIYKSNSLGCNHLIKSGLAKLTTCARDLLEEYNVGQKMLLGELGGGEVAKMEFSSEGEKQIYDTLMLEGLSIDELGKKLSLDVSSLSFTLSMLEIQGVITKTLGGKYEVK